MSLLQTLSEPWALRALLAASMVGIMCGVLGCFVVLRNMSLIGDALSHAVLPGVVVGFMLFGAGLGIFAGAVAAGLVTAVAITWVQNKVKTKPDAAIGIVFTAMFSLGVMGISWLSKTQGVHLDLKDFLFGNVLGVSNTDLGLTAMVLVYVLLSIGLFFRYFFLTTFQPILAATMGISVSTVHYFLMLLLSFAVVASLQTVGVILVVAMLITPAATALLLTNRLQTVVIIAALIGLVSAIGGFILAILLETTPGPAICITSTMLYVMAVLFAPHKGIIPHYLSKRRYQRKVYREDILKQALKLHECNTLNLANLCEKTGLNEILVRKKVHKLQRKGFLILDGNSSGLTMTEEGVKAANRLVRAHRLWETYLVQNLGLTHDQIHDDAEKYEHLLTDEQLAEMEEQLGFPEVDPHGSPIPKSNPKRSL